MKRMNLIGILIVLTASFCSCDWWGTDFYHDIENPYICFVNQSDKTVWVETMTPDEITYYEGSTEDTIFYGLEDYGDVQPHSTKRFRTDLFSPEEPNFEPFAVRVFVVDSISPPVNIQHARDDYYMKQCGMESQQVLQILKEFEQKHLLYKHWYTKKELDSMNWTIVYPQKTRK